LAVVEPRKRRIKVRNPASVAVQRGGARMDEVILG
jgi:hypothetical protein